MKYFGFLSSIVYLDNFYKEICKKDKFLSVFFCESSVFDYEEDILFVIR